MTEISAYDLGEPLILHSEDRTYVVDKYCNDDGGYDLTLHQFITPEDAQRYAQYRKGEISFDDYYHPDLIIAREARRAKRAEPPRCMKHNELLLKYRDTDSGAYVTLCPTCSGWEI